MESNLYGLSSESELHLLLSFRAKELTHSEKIEIVLEVEHQLMGTEYANKHIHLLWNSGFVNDEFTVWSEASSEQNISHEAKEALIKKSKLIRFKLPEYLDEKRNTDIQFIVFPEESYLRSMLKNHSI